MSTFQMARPQEDWCPAIITVLALAWLWIAELCKIVGPKIPAWEVKALVAYDRAAKLVRIEARNLEYVYRVGGCFVFFWLAFGMLEVLGGLVK